MNALFRALAAAGLLFAASCASLPASHRAGPPDLDVVREKLLKDDEATRTVRGVARLAFEGPHGSGSASQVVVVALPDRARVEALTPLGTTALVVTLRAEEIRVHSVLRGEYGVGRASPQTLGRLLKVAVPPELLLRLLAGLPPLPVRAQDPRLTVVSEESVVRVESTDGVYWQRMWTEANEPEIARGEVGRAAEVLFTFAFADRQPTDGRRFPFEVRVEEPATHSRVRVRYERVQLNLPADPDLFELPPPADPRTRTIDLGGVTTPRGEAPRA
jgi:hypothetical protein